MNIIYKIVGYTMLCSSFVGSATSKPAKAGWGASEWVAPKVKWVCEVVCDTVETVSSYSKATSQWIEEKSTSLYDSSQEWIHVQDGYNHSEFEFAEKKEKCELIDNEDDWVLIEK